MKLLGYVMMATVATVGVLVLSSGCQKDKPMTGTQAVHTGSQAAAPAPVKHEATSPPAQPATQLAEQTTCPVMGGPIDKNVFTEYQGKKVYFCCAGCVDKFKADPGKYISKLPQFAK